MANARKLNILTANVRGLQDKKKRREFFYYVRKMKFDIVCLQETHSTHRQQSWWRSMWGSKILFSHGTSNSTGVAILFARHLKVDILQVQRDLAGRTIIAQIQCEMQKFVIASIYGPNVDDPLFFQALGENLVNMEEENMIVCGDFNFAFQYGDNRNILASHDLSITAWREVCEQLGLGDAWRCHHPNIPGYTWHRTVQSSRLDYMFVSQHWLRRASTMNLMPNTFSDHAFIQICIDCTTAVRGPGLWKLNTSLLLDEDIVRELKQKIKEQSWEVFSSHRTSWEHLKMEIRQFLMEKAKTKAKAVKTRIADLTYRLQDLNVLKDILGLTPQEEDLKDITEMELAQLIDKKAEGARKRCRTKWLEDGEKSSKYFFALEKIRGAQRTLSSLQKLDGSLTTEPKEILHELKEYFSQFFSRKTGIQLQDGHLIHTKITDEQREALERDIDSCDLRLAAEDCPKEKTPGTDGLPSELWDCCGEELLTRFLPMVQETMETGELPQTTRTGNIVLIPKGEPSPHIKDWRPITLLNTDYKIIAKVLAARLRGLLNDLILPQQVGFVPGRQITVNVRKIIDAMWAAEETRCEALLVNLDFAKAFDSVDHESLFQIMDVTLLTNSRLRESRKR